jgi:hypothetical protein
MRHQLLGSGGSGASGVKIQNLLYKTKKKEKGVSSFFFFPIAIWDFLPHFPHFPHRKIRNLKVYDRNASYEGSGVRSGGSIFAPLPSPLPPLPQKSNEIQWDPIKPYRLRHKHHLLLSNATFITIDPSFSTPFPIALRVHKGIQVG